MFRTGFPIERFRPQRLTRLAALLLSFTLFAAGSVLLAPSAAEASFYYESTSTTLNAGEYRQIVAANGENGYYHVRLVMQTDGNLVLYTHDGYGNWTYIWTTWTYGNPGARAVFQSDGHLVVYSPTNQVLWMSLTYGHPGASLVIAGSGELTIYDTDSSILWTSGSNQLGTNYASAAPFPSTMADGALHTHFQDEGNLAQRADWQWRIDGQGAEGAYEPTDLNIKKGSSAGTHIDVLWSESSVTPYYAVTECKLWHTNGTCDQFEILFSDELATASNHMKNNGVCHEWAHRVGFADGGLAGASCITGGASTRISSKESTQINGGY